MKTTTPEHNRFKRVELTSESTDEQFLKQMHEYGIHEDQLDACRAYIECMSLNDLSGFEEAYAGEHNSDEEFAQEMAESCGGVPNSNQWPYRCIDWEQAASELMYDYIESDGYYFRNY